jgi:hypothetical protein
MNVSEVNMIAWIVRNVTRKGRAGCEYQRNDARYIHSLNSASGT